MKALHLRGTVLPEDRVRDMFVTSDGLISFDGSVADAESVWDGGVVVPGLVDVHSHLALASPARSASSPEEAAAASARLEAEAGVLAIREPGSPHPRAAIGLGPEGGCPRVFTAGRFITCPGGYIPGYAREVPAEELPDAAEDESNASGGWAKVIGDWLGPDGTFRSNFSAEDLAAAATRVHESGGRIAIHAALPETVDAAIAAGFDSIEHGLSAGRQNAEAMVAAGVTLVPTMIAMRGLPEFLDEIGIPREDVVRWAQVIQDQPAGVRAAAEAGVPVLAGTDAGMVPHGSVAQEIRLLFDAGLDSMTALGAGSWKAREFLGLPGIEEGAPADLVAFTRDPREDPSTLLDPALVILDGRILRSSAKS